MYHHLFADKRIAKINSLSFLLRELLSKITNSFSLFNFANLQVLL